MFKNKLLISVILALPFFLIVFLTFYFTGLRKYGTPSEYRQRKTELLEAREDSLRALEALTPPENVADSTLIGMRASERIRNDIEKKEMELQAIQAMIDSLKQLKTALEEQEKTVDMKQQELKTGRELLQDENAAKMAKLYDNMKTQTAIPLFLEMDDTLAVKILSNMQERSAARLLGEIAAQDVNKATRLNTLLSMDEVAK